MDRQENEEEKNEVEVNLFTEEDFTETPDGDITVDFGEAADSMLADIKSDSLYGLSKQTDADDFDPGEIATETVVNAGDVTRGNTAEMDLPSGAELDELSESINITEENTVSFVEEDDEADEARAERSRRRLRNLLVFFIVILVIIAAATGLFVWRGNTPPDVKQSDPDALQTSAAGTNTAKFQPIAADQIPDLVSYYGMTPEQAAEASGSQIALDGEATSSADPALPNVVSTRNGWLVGGSGETLASITFGMNGSGQIDYIFASFDLDAFGVADAKFDELANSNIVAASILTGVGLDPAVVDSAQLTIAANPQAVIARDSAGQEIAEFAGTTNIEGAPTEWKVTETYDHTAGVTVGDNSVIRTVSVDLR